MADGLFYRDVRPPFTTADIPAVTLAATNKALYRVADFPSLGANYFAMIGKRMCIRLFGRITTGATPGNLTLALLYGTGADANGVSVCASAAVALVANQTSLSWEAEFYIHARSLGATGTLFGTGQARFNPAVVASTAQPILVPASVPAASAAVDFTAALMPSIQALRSGSTVETMQVHDMSVEAMN